MKSETTDLDQFHGDYEDEHPDLSTPEKRMEAFLSYRGMTVRYVIAMSHVFQAMEKHGDDVSKISPQERGFMRKIINNQLHPQVYIKFDGRLRQKLSQLSMDEQRQYVGGKRVQLVVLKNDSIETLEYEPHNLEPNQILQVFANGYVRGCPEQRAWLEEQLAKARLAEVQPAVESYILDRKRHVLIVGKVEFTQRDLLNFAEKLAN